MAQARPCQSELGKSKNTFPPEVELASPLYSSAAATVQVCLTHRQGLLADVSVGHHKVDREALGAHQGSSMGTSAC